MMMLASQTPVPAKLQDTSAAAVSLLSLLEEPEPQLKVIRNHCHLNLIKF
jgi:hypothetical protein